MRHGLRWPASASDALGLAGLKALALTLRVAVGFPKGAGLSRWSAEEMQAVETALNEWIEAFDNPVRRHSALHYQSPVQFERLHTAAISEA